MLDGFIDLLKGFFDWLANYFKEYLNDMLMPLAEALPTIDWAGFGAISSYVAYVDDWIPLTWAWVFVTVYFTVLFIFLCCKLVKSFVPFL